MTEKDIYSVLRNGTPAARLEFVKSLPPTSLVDACAGLIVSEQPGMVVCAVAPLASQYAFGQDPEIGVLLSSAAHRYAVEVFDTEKDHGGLLATTLSGLASAHVHALNLMGRSADTVDFVDEYAPYYARLGEKENLPTLKLARIEALLNLNRIDEASEAIREKGLGATPASAIELERLAAKIAQLMRSDSDASEQALNAPAAKEAALLRALQSLTDSSPEFRGVFAGVVGKSHVDPSTPEGFAELDKALRAAEKVLSRGSSVQTEWTIRQGLRQATGIFLAQPTEDQVRNSLRQLNEMLVWTRTHQHKDLQSDCLWGIYLCYSRMYQPSEAADALLGLRECLEETREGINDPFKRGGVFAVYPHLFNALITNLDAAGRIIELLEAIEAAKGRVLADALVGNAGRDVTTERIYGPAKKLSKICKAATIHYVTYWVDDDKTIVVFVGKDGHVRSVPPIPLGRDAIREAARCVDPRSWDQPDPGTGMIVPDVREVLAPLISWMSPLFISGVIVNEDHVCYSVDDELSAVPMHYLLLDGAPLFERVTLSRVHNSFHLDQIVGSRRGEVVQNAIAFVVPAAEDGQQIIHSMWEPVQWLQAHRNTETISATESTLERLKTLDLRKKLVHFSIHGFFGDSARQNGPFDHCFLLLPSSHELPSKDRAETEEQMKRNLTPRRILEMWAGSDENRMLSGSHISLMACASGLSRKGLSGDALGLEWALIQAGADSILSSHWDVDASLAAAFITRFYCHWLVDQNSKAQAFSLTVSECKSDKTWPSTPYGWGAFTLTGDWR